MKKMLSIMLVVFALASCGKSEELSSKTYALQNFANDAQITLGFDTKEKRYFGSVVNRFFGRYEIDGNNLTLAAGGATMMMGPQSAMQAEQDFFALLPKVVAYKLNGKNLVLETNDGQKLEFVEIVESK